MAREAEGSGIDAKKVQEEAERAAKKGAERAAKKAAKKEAKRAAKTEEKRRRLAEKRAEKKEKEGTEDIRREGTNHGGKGDGSKGGSLWARIRKLPPSYILKCVIALACLIFIVVLVLNLADYFDKRPDTFLTDEGYEHSPKFVNCVPITGIDVSIHQEGDINWQKVKSSGADFVFVRAGYRAADDGSLHSDDSFDENVERARKAGLMVGAYFYSQALSADEAKEEAEFVLDMVTGHEITLPLVIDYEIYKGGRLEKKIDAGELYAASLYHDIVLGFTETVEAEGYESAVYANKDMLTNYMQADLLDDKATIWLASYNESAGLNADYMFWQCSSGARVTGYDGDVDQNFWYIKPEKVYETRGKHRKRAVSIGDCRITFKENTVKLRHFRAEPKYGMTYEGKNMKQGRDYVSSVIHNTQEGTGYVVVRGIGKYKDWIAYPFTIEK